MDEKNCMLITPNRGSLLGSSMCFFYPSAWATTLAMGPQNTEEPLGLPLYSIKGVHLHAPSLSKHIRMSTNLTLPTNLVIYLFAFT